MSTILNNPRQTLNILPDRGIVQNTPQKVLFVGQKSAGGTAVAGDLIEILNDNAWDGLFGAKSMLAGGLRRARQVNEVTQFFAIALDDDGGAVASTATVTFTGAPTETGTLEIAVGSLHDYNFTLSILTTDTPTTIGDKLEAAITANVNIPFSAANVAGVVTVTAENGGTESNSTTLGYTGAVTGVTVVLTAFASGVTNPDTSTIFDNLATLRFQTIVSPYGWGTTYLTDFLDPRFNTDNIILDGVGLSFYVDSAANGIATGTPLNSQSLVLPFSVSVDVDRQKGAEVFELPYVLASEIAGIRSLRLTENADISEFVIVTDNARDTFGGAAIASLPYFNTPLPFISFRQGIVQGLTNVEINALTAAGISPIGFNRANNDVLLGQMATTYKTDAAANPDETFKFLNYVDTSSNIREFMFFNGQADFAQSRLTQGNLQPFRAIQNEQTIRATYARYYDILADDDYVLTQAGNDALSIFKANLNVTLDLEQGLVIIIMRVPIVTQLRQIIATLQISFNI